MSGQAHVHKYVENLRAAVEIMRAEQRRNPRPTTIRVRDRSQ